MVSLNLEPLLIMKLTLTYRNKICWNRQKCLKGKLNLMKDY